MAHANHQELERTVLGPFVELDRTKVRIDALLLYAASGQSDGQRSSVHGDIDVVEEVGKCPDVIFVPMREDNALHVVGASHQ